MRLHQVAALFTVCTAAMLACGTARSFGGGSLNGRRVFPLDNIWNQDISTAPVDPNSDNLIASIGLNKPLHPDFGTTFNGAPMGIPYILVPGSQPRVPIQAEYADESDPGPYPIPANAPIEGGPQSEGDRHVLVIDKDNWILYEMWNGHKNGNGWRCGSAAIFDLKTNKERQAGWGSADAAGLPIFPGLVRYDECVEQKAITHALRFTVVHSRKAYVPPARHFASKSNDPNLPPMGMRVRLKAGFDISGFPESTRVILNALKKYGMIVADNGGDWFLSGSPDSRWKDDDLNTLKQVHGGGFEVVRMGEIVTR
jgi:hypothetical protein